MHVVYAVCVYKEREQAGPAGVQVGRRTPLGGVIYRTTAIWVCLSALGYVTEFVSRAHWWWFTQGGIDLVVWGWLQPAHNSTYNQQLL